MGGAGEWSRREQGWRSRGRGGEEEEFALIKHKPDVANWRDRVEKHELDSKLTFLVCRINSVDSRLLFFLLCMCAVDIEHRIHIEKRE